MATSSRIAKFLPSKEFLDKLKLSRNGSQQMKLYNQILKELELVEYFHNKVPKTINDFQWSKLLRTKSIIERVSMIEYFALTESRERLAKEDAERSTQMFAEKMEIEKAKFDAGQMGYGPNFYQLMLNPFRNDKNMNLISGFRQYKTRYLADKPRIAFDCQYFSSMSVRDTSKMSEQLSMCLTENNVKFREPFHIELLNLDLNEENVRGSPLSKTYAYLNHKHSHQMILPDLYPDMHYQRNNKKVYYVSRHARKVFDGPLDPECPIILPVTKDDAKETINTVKKYQFTPIFLPVRKYVKWEVGHFFLPLPNILRIFNAVSNGESWENAITRNVAQRHTTTIAERREKMKEHYDRIFQAKKDKYELIEMISNTIKAKSSSSA